MKSIITCFLTILLLFGYELRESRGQDKILGGFSKPTQTEILNNTIFLIFKIGQSNNADGRATSERITTILGEPSEPEDVFIYYKPDYTAADNGSFIQLVEGSTNTREPGETPIGMSGSSGMLGSRLKAISPNPVYIVMMGDGGTALKENLTSPDWYEGSSGECFDIAVNRYYIVAYNKLVAANPGKTIAVVIDWAQGESDALDADGTSGYATRFRTFVPALRASHFSLESALLVITKLYYMISANEATINSAFQSYADSNPVYVKIVDISAYPRVVDLTVGQQGGIASVGGASEHTSYLGMEAKADQTLQHIIDFYLPWL